PARPSPLPWSLVATMVSAETSTATLLDSATHRSGAYGVGDEVPGVGPVRRILPRRVEIWNRGALRTQRLDPVAAPSAPSALREIDRSVFSQPHTELHIVPAIQAGRASGFRVYGIRPGSLPDRLGLQNGDTVVSVNGLPITTPDEALTVYGELHTARTLSVEILRRGAPVRLEYTLH